MTVRKTHPENRYPPGTTLHDMDELYLAVRDLGRVLAKEPPFRYVSGVLDWLDALVLRWERHRQKHCSTVEYSDQETAQIIAVFPSEALARAFWAALPPGRWGSYVLCQEHCDVREYPVLDALPEMRLYAGKRPMEAGKP